VARNEPQESGPPGIVVAYRPHPGCAQALHEVCAGIEEEGMHFRAVELEAADAAGLAHQAALCSQLLVGVGIDEGELCVQLAALPADAPLERLTVGSDESGCQRHVGHNAARLVKVMPLKGYGYGDGEETDVLQPGEARAEQVRQHENKNADAAVTHGGTTNDAEVSQA
jgi:hypothetical protein